MKISSPLRATLIILVAAIACAGPPVATAETEIPTPTFTVKAKAVPIPGFPGTGNFYGKGADLEGTMEIQGTGYGATAQNPSGGIPPLSAVNVWLPKGVKLDQKDFKTVCTEATLKNIGPSACPKASAASTIGSVLGEVTFGSTRVPEEATLQSFFGPGGDLLFFTHGASPVNLEIVSTGRYVRSSGKYSWELETLVPAVASVPGAPLASAKMIHVKLGAAIRRHGKVVPYGTVPKKGECPHGGFYGKVELTFGGMYGGEREFGIAPKSVSQVIRVACPKH